MKSFQWNEKIPRNIGCTEVTNPADLWPTTSPISTVGVVAMLVFSRSPSAIRCHDTMVPTRRRKMFHTWTGTLSPICSSGAKSSVMWDLDLTNFEFMYDLILTFISDLVYILVLVECSSLAISLDSCVILADAGYCSEQEFLVAAHKELEYWKNIH